MSATDTNFVRGIAMTLKSFFVNLACKVFYVFFHTAHLYYSYHSIIPGTPPTPSSLCAVLKLTVVICSVVSCCTVNIHTHKQRVTGMACRLSQSAQIHIIMILGYHNDFCCFLHVINNYTLTLKC